MPIGAPASEGPSASAAPTLQYNIRDAGRMSTVVRLCAVRIRQACVFHATAAEPGSIKARWLFATSLYLLVRA
jgi:hypothetical protein